MSSAPGLNCPSCRVALVMSERQGIEIDYCPQCRGIWLDRGELDKIIERASRETAPAPQPSSYTRPPSRGVATMTIMNARVTIGIPSAESHSSKNCSTDRAGLRGRNIRFLSLRTLLEDTQQPPLHPLRNC